MTQGSRPRALLLDFDGVLRRFDPAIAAGVEQRYQLPPGSLLGTLLTPDLLRAASLGEITDAQWRDRVAQALDAPEAVEEWAAYRGEIDREVLEFSRELRAAGVPVALATNATDRLDADLALLGLAEEFGVVLNSSALGAAKPSREFYLAAARALGTPPASCLLVDDVERNVAGARAVGMYGYRWTGSHDLPYLRAVLRA